MKKLSLITSLPLSLLRRGGMLTACLLAASLFLGISTARAADDDNRLWTLQLAYHDATQTVAAGSKVYAVMNGNLISYDTADQSVQTYDKLSGLSSKGISQIAWCQSLKELVILYTDNDLDLLAEDGTVTNLPQIKNYSEDVITPVALSVSGTWATISTTQGVVLVDLSREEIRGFYQLGKRVNYAAVTDDNIIYAAVSTGLLKGRIIDNLYDPTQWHQAVAFPPGYFLLAMGKGLFILPEFVSSVPSKYAGLTYVSPSTDINSLNVLTRVSDQWMGYGTLTADGSALFSSYKKAFTVKPEDPLTVAEVRSLAVSLPRPCLTTDGTYWGVTSAADTLYNLRPVTDASGALTTECTDVQVGNFGPRRDLCYKMQYVGDRLLVAGGRMDYEGGKNFLPTAMVYEKPNWSAFPTTGFKLNSGEKFQNVTSIAQDPADPSHHFISCTSGLLEFRDFQFVKHYNATNSPLAIAAGGGNNPNYNIVDGLVFDADGNLWMTNYETPAVLKVLLKDGTWASLTDSEFTNISTPDKTLIDNQGHLWVSVRRSSNVAPSGLYCLDYNGTPADQSDDKSLFRSTANNEDGTSCNLDAVHTMALDNNGQLWFGCDAGVFAVTRPSEWFDASWTVYQPKVPRNDGTNYADYLLTGIPVTAIAVDGGNRKWLGTEGSGLYLVNEDGSKVIQHITAEDSPLLSDNILSLALDNQTGNLMIGTDKGMCSYRTYITSGLKELVKSNTKIFPNPVRPEFNGPLTITGLTQSAEVKVVTAGSQLVATLTSIGGTCQWDLTSQASGRRVAPGVYYLMMTTADGKKSIIGKVVVI